MMTALERECERGDPPEVRSGRGEDGKGGWGGEGRVQLSAVY
jgi:hypothetical protein